jgi:site-specific DNA-adenine methylase
MAARYPGSKSKLSKWIVPYIPEKLHYYEPFAGLAYVFKRLRESGQEMLSYHLSDLNTPLVNFHLACQGDREITKEYGDLFARWEAVRDAFMPEEDHEREIYHEFRRCCDILRDLDDPYAWAFVQSYAVGQYCGRFRRDIASFDPQFIRGGISVMTMERLHQWRELLQNVGIQRCDALPFLRQLNKRDDADKCICYLDPTYISTDARRWHSFNMYGFELSRQQHEQLLDLLRVAQFRFILSLQDAPLVREWYLHDESFRSPFRAVDGFYAVRLVPTNSGRRKGKPRGAGMGRPEWLIMNYDPSGGTNERDN